MMGIGAVNVVGDCVNGGTGVACLLSRETGAFEEGGDFTSSELLPTEFQVDTTEVMTFGGGGGGGDGRFWIVGTGKFAQHSDMYARSGLAILCDCMFSTSFAAEVRDEGLPST